MKKNNLISGFFWFLIGLGFTFGGFRYGFGSWKEPGPGLLPVVFGSLLSVLSIGLLIPSVKKRKAHESRPFSPEEEKEGSWKSVLLTLVALIAYMIVLKEAGFVLTTFLFTFSLMKFVGGKRWVTSFFFAALLSIACYGLFYNLLGTPLPKGRIYGSAFRAVAWS